MSTPKQVLIWRADLRNVDGHKVRTGKIAAQLAHASLLGIMKYKDYAIPPIHVRDWLDGDYTKVCLQSQNIDDMFEIYDQAINAGINAMFVIDNGLTEFGGNRTITALSLGPDYPEMLDPLTSHLKLL